MAVMCPIVYWRFPFAGSVVCVLPAPLYGREMHEPRYDVYDLDCLLCSPLHAALPLLSCLAHTSPRLCTTVAHAGPADSLVLTTFTVAG